MAESQSRAPGEQHDPPSGDDKDLLAELGYKQELPRALRLWTIGALGFAFISPIVGLYTVFALGTQTAGPAWVWALPIVVLGQLLVALVFAHLSSKWPLAGGIYQWSRRLIGPGYGWWAGWTYMWALILTVSTVAYGGGFFLGQFLGWEDQTATDSVILAAAVMAICGLVNALGQHLLRWVINIAVACSLVAAVAISLGLLAVARQQPVDILVNAGATPDGTPFFPAFIAALAIAGWVIIGFDACGSLAEETIEPRRQVPRAIVISLVAVGLIDIIAAVALLLAQPDLAATVSGYASDPVSGAVIAGLGDWAEWPFLALVVIGFISCGIAVQATAVRVVYSYSRDGMLPLSRIWSRVSPTKGTPVHAVLLVTVLSTLAFLYANVLEVLVTFATAAYYVSFLFPVAALLYQRVQGGWSHRHPDGRSSAGTMAWFVNIVAALWLAFQVINIAWPRDTGLPWWLTYAIPFGALVFGGLGMIYFVLVRPDRKFVKTSMSAGSI